MRCFRFGKLHGHRSNRAGCSCYEDALAAGKLAVIEDSLPRCERTHRDRCRGIEIDVPRLAHELTGGRGDIFRVATAVGAKIPVDLVSSGEIRPASLFNRTAHFAPENERQFQTEQLAKPIPDFPIHWIYRCRLYFDQNLTCGRPRPLYIRELQYLFVAV